MKLNKIVLLTQQSLQNENLKNMLVELTGLPIELRDVKCSLLDEGLDDVSVLLIDFAVEMSEENAHYIMKNNALKSTILLNLNAELEPQELIKWPCVKGVFGAKDTVEQLSQGIRAVADGANWLPRHTLDQLINYYQEHGSERGDNILIDIDLTRREVQVLQFLKNGGSNMEIADSLFISEHTIKSHLYNIFRKIDVKNRTQATAWARKNLV
ncbi:helix-turn-helix transcriptional regulator [Vibrio sp. SM6]|uniref:Helix-turn-helix transcriptional regulator n=1 Tax=Vibrio agarilyticus TaxID=2726741 RepID=A0A7X8TNC9_9VIBR|nr:LuxR C-terminal-related transcriptional regulator [Vibrio agarilyticus]NLS11745.1 helix-turn-helix transcriptional regulator [Vibrio agarilyticus]